MVHRYRCCAGVPRNVGMELSEWQAWISGTHLHGGVEVMALYVSVRGWLECDRFQLSAVKEVIAKHADDHYSGGWGFPIHPFNWTSYVFYGGDIQRVTSLGCVTNWQKWLFCHPKIRTTLMCKGCSCSRMRLKG
jgi:hypothetical protein